MKRLTKVQLWVFAVVTVISVVYGSVRFLGAGDFFDPPYRIKAEFEHSGGIYPRADVELLGTRIGSVEAIEPGKSGGSIVVMAIDDGVRIPRDVLAQIGNKSAIGEQYVELTPNSASGPLLESGDTIPRARTSSPLLVEKLLGDLHVLAASIPLEDLDVALTEMSAASTDLADPLGRMIDSSDKLTADAVANTKALTALIDNARTVLDTQAELAPQTATSLEHLAGLTEQFRRLEPDTIELFADGIRASHEITNLLSDNQRALPLMLNDLLSITVVVGDRRPALRKALVVFPYALELAGTSIRYCEDLNARTGQPVEATCDYDENGDPIYKSWLAMQLGQPPDKPPYYPCTKGYEGTKHYLPDGTPADGAGPHEAVDQEPNLEAGCMARPSDPDSPNVRGAQNTPGYLPGWRAESPRPAPGWAVFDGNTGLLVTPEGSYRIRDTSGPPLPTGDDGLAWLLGRTLTEGN